MRSNQKVRFGRGRELSVNKFFRTRNWKSTTLKLRGHRDTVVHYCSALLTIQSHGLKYRVVALKYESVVSDVVNDDEPVQALERLKTQLQEFQIRNTSTKHLSGRTMLKFTPKIKNVLHSEKMAA